MDTNKINGKLFVLSAPSGAGKTSLAKECIRRLSEKFDISRVTTWTTRTPRPGEENDKDYHFIDKEEFEKKFKDGFFLESTKYNGQLYGSSKDTITRLKQGENLIIVTDLRGVRLIKKEIPDAKFFWITAPSLEELKRRLLKRENNDKSKAEKRLELAEEEIKEAEKPRMFDYNVVNDVFDKTVSELCLLIKKEIL